jgi:hypothetical protein
LLISGDCRFGLMQLAATVTALTATAAAAAALACRHARLARTVTHLRLPNAVPQTSQVATPALARAAAHAAESNAITAPTHFNNTVMPAYLLHVLAGDPTEVGSCIIRAPICAESNAITAPNHSQQHIPVCLLHVLVAGPTEVGSCIIRAKEEAEHCHQCTYSPCHYCLFTAHLHIVLSQTPQRLAHASSGPKRRQSSRQQHAKQPAATAHCTRTTTHTCSGTSRHTPRSSRAPPTVPSLLQRQQLATHRPAAAAAATPSPTWRRLRC